MEEQVLTVPAKLLHDCGYFQGFQPADTRDLSRSKFAPLLDPSNQKFVPRKQAEQDPNLKQLIPYVMISPDEGGLISYWRGKGQGEARLHGKRSVGFGGHINPCDAGADSNMYVAGMLRELIEEVIIEPDLPDQTIPVIGFVNDDGTEVGKVHLGVVHMLMLQPSQLVRAREADMLDLSVYYVGNSQAEFEQFEVWSQLCLKGLLAKLQIDLLATTGAVISPWAANALLSS